MTTPETIRSEVRCAACGRSLDRRVATRMALCVSSADMMSFIRQPRVFEVSPRSIYVCHGNCGAPEMRQWLANECCFSGQWARDAQC